MNAIEKDILDMTDDELDEYIDSLPEQPLNAFYCPTRNWSDDEMDMHL